MSKISAKKVPERYAPLKNQNSIDSPRISIGNGGTDIDKNKRNRSSSSSSRISTKRRKQSSEEVERFIVTNFVSTDTKTKSTLTHLTAPSITSSPSSSTLPIGHVSSIIIPLLPPPTTTTTTTLKSSSHHQTKTLLMDSFVEQADNTIIQLHFTAVLAALRDLGNTSLKSENRIPNFDCRTINIQHINGDYMDTLFDFIFSKCEKPSEVNELLNVVVLIVLYIHDQQTKEQITKMSDQCWWNPREWTAFRLCDVLFQLMSGELEMMTCQHAVVFHVIKTIQSLKVSQKVFEKIVALPWMTSSPLIRLHVASIVANGTA